MNVGDPVASGTVARLDRPGENSTGELHSKGVDLFVHQREGPRTRRVRDQASDLNRGMAFSRNKDLIEPMDLANMRQNA